LASRQVILLTKGYQLGRLDFKYKNPLSRLRETYLLREIEREEQIEILRIKTLVDAAMVGGMNNRTKKLVAMPYDSLEEYAGLTLPYMYKKAKIDNTAIDTPEQIAYWKNILKEQKREFDEAEKKKQSETKPST